MTVDTLGELRAVRTTVLEEERVPPPGNLAGIPTYALDGVLRPSIFDAFVGRADELWQIHHELDTLRGASSDAARTAALEAGGGFGKTTLATEYLHRYGPRSYRGGLFWIDAGDAERLEEQFHGVLAILRPDVPDLVDFRRQGRDARKELASALHEADPAKPVLYVVDGIPEPASGDSPRPLEHWCPAIGKVALLVSSRARQSVTAGVRALPVDVLRLEPAVSLLRRGCPDAARRGDDAWARIAEWVGRLPIALELLNASLCQGVFVLDELVAEAADSDALMMLDRSAEALRGLVPPDRLPALSRVFSLTYQRLDPEAQLAARLLAHLASAPIPMEVLDALDAPLESGAVRGKLVARSLVRPSESAGTPMFGTMHLLVAQYLRAQGGDQEIVMVADALSKVIGSERSRDAATWALMRTCLPHAREVFDRLRAAAPTEGVTGLGARVRRRLGGGAPPRATTEKTTLLGIHITALLARQGLTTAARIMGETVAAMARTTLGPEHRLTLISTNNLAEILRDLGDVEVALRMCEEVCEIRRRRFGPEHPDTLATINNLAQIRAAMGHVESALQEHEKAHEACVRRLGPRHPDTLNSANNRAELLRAQGHFEAALLMHSENYATRREVLGAEHPDTLNSLDNIGATRYALGDAEGAVRAHEEAHEAFLRLLGADHRDTLTSANNLATAYMATGDAERARTLLEAVYDKRRRLLGPEHPETLLSAENLGNAYEDPERARPLLEGAYEVRRRRQGGDHPDSIYAAENLANLYEGAGEFERARPLLKIVYETRVRLLGLEHHDTLSSAGRLALVNYALGDAEGAHPPLEHLYGVYRRTLGPDHPDTLRWGENLAVTLDVLDDTEGARRLRNEIEGIDRG